MYRYEQIEDQDLKTSITNNILRKLPDWFGIEKSIIEYAEGTKDKIFYAAYDKDDILGLLSIELNNKYTAEIYVIGVLEDYHRNGIGRNLILKAEQDLRKDNYRFLMVKTLGESYDYEPYHRTRGFYNRIGFYPIFETNKIWDEDNPCLIMIKNI